MQNSRKKYYTHRAQIHIESYSCHVLSIFSTDISVARSDTETLVLMRKKIVSKDLPVKACRYKKWQHQAIV